MPIRKSSISGGSSSTGFNLDVGASGNTTFVFSEAQPAGGYSITSQLTDSSIEFYAIAEDGTVAGYTNTKALSATKDFDTLVVYGATTNDLITFEYKSTTLPTASGDQDSGAAPFITSISDADLASLDDTTIITGGNFATDVAVTFTGTDAVVRSPKSVVRTDSTQLIVTRPDDFLPAFAAYTMTVSNPGITQSAIVTNTSSITAGGGPVWVTSAGALGVAQSGQAYSYTVEATDPDGEAISYSIVDGELPEGLSLNSSTGEISGTATGLSQSFTILATDSGGNIANRSFSISTVVATGGTEQSIPGYKIHTFTSSGTLVTNIPLTIDYLAVAGGGGGSGRHSGGGGAGQVNINNGYQLAAGTYTITIGAGGAGVTGTSSIGGYGGDTVFLESVRGGGPSGTYSINPANGYPGGSGGGGGYNGQGSNVGGSSNKYSSTLNATTYGNAGGGNSPWGSGGGGAGEVGESNPNGPANGGDGIPSSILGTSYYWGGGGGGSLWSSADTKAGDGGLGGGGGGGHGTDNKSGATAGFGGGSALNPGSDGIATGDNGSPSGGDGGANTGGGGGGSGQANHLNYTGYGGSGGSGIVIIRYPA